MSNKLTSAVDAYISRVLPPAKKEIEYVTDEDWSSIKNVNARSNAYAVHHLITNRNVTYAVELYKMAGDDVRHKRVQKTLELLISFFYKLDERYKSMIDKFDFTKFDPNDEKESSKVSAEVEFQSKVLAHITSMDSKLREINFGGQSTELGISLHGNKVIPFMMSELAERVFPEIKDYLKEKEENTEQNEE